MNELKFRTCLFLILIKYYPKFRDSYSLTKILSWNFGIIEFTDVSRYVVAMALADADIDERKMHHYIITRMGETYLNEHAKGAFITAFDERYAAPNELAKIIRDKYLQQMLDEASG